MVGRQLPLEGSQNEDSAVRALHHCLGLAQIDRPAHPHRIELLFATCGTLAAEQRFLRLRESAPGARKRRATGNVR
jgi:hypothetical protein